MKLEGTISISDGLGLVSRFAAKGDLAARITDATDCDQQRLVWVRRVSWLFWKVHTLILSVLIQLRQISEAIEYLHHNKKIIHGDIKPANILLTSENEALLCDFGLSKSPLYPTTGDNHIGAGSRDFQAPAQRISNGLNRVPKNEESDLFAFGMTMLQVIDNRVPIGKESGLINLMHFRVLQVISRQHVDLSKAELSIPPAVCSDAYKAIWALGKRCVQKEAGHRPTSAEVITERLKEMEQGEFHKVYDWISQEVRRCS